MLKVLKLTTFLALPGAAIAQDAPPISVAVPALLETFDPGLALGNAGVFVSHNTFDMLVRRDFRSNELYTGKEYVPGLAESWERVDDLTTIFTLREGVKFQNGAPVTPEDVKFTFDRILDRDSLYVSARTYLSNIASVEVLDDRRVKIITKAPDAGLLDFMAYPGTAIVPKAYFEEVGFEKFGQMPIGAGPYVIESFVPDQELKLTAFGDYWQGAPAASSVSFKIVPEVSARITALANGEVEIAAALPPDQVEAVGAIDGVSVKSVLVNSHVLYYNMDHPALTKKVRQAMNLAIDRELLAEALWLGNAMVLNGHQYEEWGEPLYVPGRPGFEYNPEKAKALLAEAGYNGEEIVFHTHAAYYTNGLASAEAITEMWREVGLNARVQVNEQWSRVKSGDLNFGARNGSDWILLPDPLATIGWTWGVSGHWTEKADFLKMTDEARSTLDPQKRSDVYQKALDLLEEEAPGTVLYRAHEFYGVSDKIEWHPYATYMMDFRSSALSFK